MAILHRVGAQIYFETWLPEVGPREWVTLINGHTRPCSDFRMMAKSLTARGLGVASLDNRGAGRTVSEAPFTLDHMAEDVEAVWGEVGVSSSHVVGFSMGGFVAQILALKHSQRIDRLVLVSTASKVEDSFVDDETPWGDSEESVLAKLQPYFYPDFFLRNKVLITAMSRQVLKNIADGEFAANAKQQRSAMRGFDHSNRLEDIEAQTLVIHGANDEILAPLGARQMADGIRQCRLEMVPESGHLLLAERPQELYRLVGEFVVGEL